MAAFSDDRVTGELMHFASETNFNDIPDEVIEFSKKLILKTVAGMIIGPSKPTCRKMIRIIKERRLPEDCGVIGSGFKTSLWETSFLHAFFAHASELEDNRITPEGGASWDITVIPVVFSLIEKLRLSGKSLLEALIIGMEVHARTSMFNSEHLGLSFIPGAVGPAIAAGKAYNFSPNQMGYALALSTSSTALTHINFATDTHYFESAMSSLHGIMSADLAKEGMTGNPSLIEYLSKLLGKDAVEPSKMVKDLKKKWLQCEIWFKKYPCCFLTHRPIDITIEVMMENNLSIDDVKQVTVEVSPIDMLCDRPEPQTEGDLQFSLQHLIGVAMLYKDVDYNHVSPEAVGNPKLQDARKKVYLNCHPDYPDQLDKAMTLVPAHLTFELNSGEIIVKQRDHMIGSPQEPLTLDQVKELYAKFTRSYLSQQQIKHTCDIITHIEEYPDLEELIDILVYRHKYQI